MDDLNEKSDDELIAIANGKIPYTLSAGSTTTPEDIKSQAKAILHKRQHADLSVLGRGAPTDIKTGLPIGHPELKRTNSNSGTTKKSSVRWTEKIWNEIKDFMEGCIAKFGMEWMKK